ncbi:hypothetical protein SGLAM104S_07691 [Streptomyces glaucescens]
MATKCMVQMPVPMAEAAVISQLRRAVRSRRGARAVQRSPSAAPVQAMTYDSAGVSQPKAAWSRCPMAPGR